MRVKEVLAWTPTLVVFGRRPSRLRIGVLRCGIAVDRCLVGSGDRLWIVGLEFAVQDHSGTRDRGALLDPVADTEQVQNVART